MKTTRTPLTRKLAATLAVVLAAIGLTTSAFATGSTSVVIYELYGAGGNAGAVLNEDYAVLYNLSASPVSINGWSLQYAALTGTAWTPLNLPNATIPAGGYYCVGMQGSTNGTAFLTDFSNTNATSIGMAAGGGKLALLNVTNKLAAGVANPFGSNNVIDVVGAAGANGGEGTPAGVMSLTQVLQRKSLGCQDTDSNTNDFVLVTIASGYQPAYGAFPTHSCSSPNVPTIFSVTPTSQTVNAGTIATFSAELSGGDAPLTNYWYLGTVAPGNLVSTSTNTTGLTPNPTLTLANVGSPNAGTYVLVVSNAAGAAGPSSGVTLNVNDPAINVQPANEQGLLGGTTHFTVGAAGSPLVYQWYFAATNGAIIGPVGNTVNTYSTSVNSGSTTGTLNISGLTTNDITNYLVIVSNTLNHNSLTSSVASLALVAPTVQLALWNFNGNTFSNNIQSPPTYFGIGTASVANTVGTSGTADGNDGAALPGFGLGGPPYLSWGSAPYPTQGTSNKTAGMQFLTSTVGANHIGISYESRATGTASEYERLQYTTNGGSTWVDYPASTTFGKPLFISTVSATTNQNNSGYTTSTYGAPNPFTYNLTGFPGVDNNPNFGFRVVTEFESTGTYGLSPSANYYGVANAYGTGGTLTYDLVTVTGTAITNNSAVPTIGPILDTNVNDFQTVTVTIPVNNTANPPGNLVLSATEVDTYNVLGLNSGSFIFGGSGTSRTMQITPLQGFDGIEPILVTATDNVTGLSASTWFYLTVLSVNGAPTNGLGGFSGTNTQYNANASVPFTVGDDHTAAASLTYSAVSSNNTVIPSGNISFNTSVPTSPVVIIAPNASPQTVGVAPVSVTITDDGVVFNSIPHTDVRTTTAIFPVEVLPNTNVVLIDYFNYDNSGPLAIVGGGFWGHLSGNGNQIQVGGAMPGYATINTLAQTENLQAKLIGAPYLTNSAAVLYASFDVNMDPGNMPNANGGTYFAVFNDGSGATGNYSDRIVASTNGAAPGFYRVGVNNAGSDATTGVTFSQDLVPGADYKIVTQVVASNGFSTLWINPSSSNSVHVTDTTPVATHFNISDFELRSSGGNGGVVRVSKLKVGKTFDSVLPTIAVQAVGANAVVTSSSDPTIGVRASTNNPAGPYVPVSTGTPYTNAISTNNAVYYQFTP